MKKCSWSEAIDNYVCKEDTHVEGPFEVGKLDIALESKGGSSEFDLTMADLPELYPWQKKICEFHRGPLSYFIVRFIGIGTLAEHR